MRRPIAPVTFRRDNPGPLPFRRAVLRVLLSFASGYYLSYLFRTVGALVSGHMMAPIHDRMPVVLEPVDWPVWLGEEDGDPKILLRPAADTVLKARPVSTDVNSVRHNGVELLRPMREESVVGGPNPA